MRMKVWISIVMLGSVMASSTVWAYTVELLAPGNGSYLTGQLIYGKTATPVFNIPVVNMMARIYPAPALYVNHNTNPPVFHFKFVPTGDEKTIAMHWLQNMGGAAIYIADVPWDITHRRRQYDCYVTWNGLTSNRNRVHIAKGRQAELIAEQWLGSPYHWGGKGPARCPGNPTHGAPNYCFDCSGLVWWCYEKTNIFLAGGPSPPYNRNAQWFHDNRLSTPSDPIKGEYITFGDSCQQIDHIAMQREVGFGCGTIEATPPCVLYGRYNPSSPRTDHYGSLFYPEERPPGD